MSLEGDEFEGRAGGSLAKNNLPIFSHFFNLSFNLFYLTRTLNTTFSYSSFPTNTPGFRGGSRALVHWHADYILRTIDSRTASGKP